MTTHKVESATAADEAAVVGVITLAFGGRAFAHGSAHRVDGCAGAALWLPPGVHPDEATMADLMRRSVPERLTKDVLAMVEQMARYHPREPLWYLPFIGVD